MEEVTWRADLLYRLKIGIGDFVVITSGMGYGVKIKGTKESNR